jgi:hypothetical protein
MLCSDVQCCYNSSCGYRLFPCFVVCCVVMHSVVITAPVDTDCSHGMSYVVVMQCCYNISCGNRLFPWDVVCSVVMQCCYSISCGNRLFPWDVVYCVVMHSVVITALVVTDCSHGLSYVV